MKLRLPSREEALPGRAEPLPVAPRHYVNGAAMLPPFPPELEIACFGMGCFWGAERKFWQAGGVYATAVGYAGGHTPNPTYEEVCSGRTGHAEVVRVVFDPRATSFTALSSGTSGNMRLAGRSATVTPSANSAHGAADV